MHFLTLQTQDNPFIKEEKTQQNDNKERIIADVLDIRMGTC